jgi:hypothetical protein
MTKEEYHTMMAKIEVEVIILDQMIMEAWAAQWAWNHKAEPCIF